MIEQLQCLRALPVTLKPRLVKHRGGYWLLTVPPWRALRGDCTKFVSRWPELALDHWLRDVENVHGIRFEVLVYRARREYYEMRAMLLHAGKP